MKIIKYYFFAVIFPFIITGCEKEDELLDGVWERVNVEDIGADYIEEWHFFDRIITIKQISKENPDDISVLDEGIYILKPVFNKTYLSLKNLDRHPAYTYDWHVLTLNSDQMVIINDELNGTLKREFIKKD